MSKNPKVAIVRGAFLNEWEMQNYLPLKNEFDLTAFSSLNPLSDNVGIPIVKLSSPMDFPDFSLKMPVLNRLFVDAHWLFGLEEKLKGFDIVHVAETYYAYTQQALSAKRKGWVKKVVSTCWEIIAHNNEGIRNRYDWKKRAIKEIDEFICPTEMAKDCLVKEGCQPEKISVIRMGVDLAKFHKVRPCSDARSDLKQRITLLFVGRLENEKGIWELLKAFKSLANSFTLPIPPIHNSSDPGSESIRSWIVPCGSSLGKVAPCRDLLLTIVGEGSQREKIANFIKSNSLVQYIKLKGNVAYDKIIEEYNKADIFVLPSKPTKTWQEQYGMVLVEAMACGLPIITTRNGAIPEVVGNGALLVEPGNIGQLVQAILKLSKDDKQRTNLKKINLKRTEFLFDAAKIAKKIENIYQSFL